MGRGGGGVGVKGGGGYFKTRFSFFGGFLKAEFCHEVEKFHPWQCFKSH